MLCYYVMSYMGHHFLQVTLCPMCHIVSCSWYCALHVAVVFYVQHCISQVPLCLKGRTASCMSLMSYKRLKPPQHGIPSGELLQCRAQTHSCGLRRAESGCKATAQGWTVGVPHCQARREQGRTPIRQMPSGNHKNCVPDGAAPGTC